ARNNAFSEDDAEPRLLDDWDDEDVEVFGREKRLLEERLFLDELDERLPLDERDERLFLDEREERGILLYQ
ncbi:MAG: hypothetical protein AAFR31_18220, partial [Cyanobacteria bacterium J06627_8]